MGNLLGGSFVGLLFGCLFGFVYFIVRDSYYRSEKQERIDKLITFGIIFVSTFLVGFSVLFGVRVGYASRISRVKAVQQSYIDSLESEYITDMQRISVANQISLLNGDIAELKYRNSQWYGFDVPNEVQELEIIDLSRIGEK